MIEKYAKQLKQSTTDFMYLGKMSTDNFIDSLYDDEIDDISKWMAKNFGLDVSTGSKKDKAVAKWIEEAFAKRWKLLQMVINWLLSGFFEDLGVI